MAARRERQRAEILGLLAAAQLDRASDLAHRHLAEFPDDRSLEQAVVAALGASADRRLRRRASEFRA